MQCRHSVLLALTTAAIASASANAQVYERIDVNAQGVAANDHSGNGDISDDGRFVAFTTRGSNLDGVEAARTYDVFLRDRVLGTTTRISTSANVAQEIHTCCISGDGSTVAYTRGNIQTPSNPLRSYAYNVAAGTTVQITGLPLLHLLVTGLSRDGQFAVGTAQTGSDPTRHVYRVAVGSGAVVLVSHDLNGNPVRGSDPVIDDAGTHVAFTSDSASIVSNDANGTILDVFVCDIPGNITLLASVASDGTQSNSAANVSAISGDGRYVTMSTYATNLSLADSNFQADVYLRDLRLGTMLLVSLDTNQINLVNGAVRSVISGDGSTVALWSQEALVPGDSTTTYDTFIRDLNLGALLPSSPGSAITMEDTGPSSITRDGREVVLASRNPALGASVNSTGCFVASFGPRCSTLNYCTSFPNSTGAPATIGTQGDASRALNNLVISGVGMPDGATAMLVSGTTAVDPGVPFGNGLLCIGGTITRHGIHVASGGVILDFQDVNSPEYAAVHPGDTRNYQVFYRDPAAGGALFNTTDAVAVTFCW